MIIIAQATADFTILGPTPLNNPDTPSSYTQHHASSPTRYTLPIIPNEGNALPERTCCCVFTTSNGFTRNDANAPAVAPQMKLFAGLGRFVFFTTDRVCSKLHKTRTQRRHEPMQRGEGDIAQQVRVDAFPEVKHAVDRSFVAYTTNRADHAAGHSSVQLALRCVPRLRLRLEELQRLHADDGQRATQTSRDRWNHPSEATWNQVQQIGTSG